MPRDAVEMIVTDVPQEMREALLRRAREAGTSVNEVATAVLCSAFTVKYQPSGRSFYRPQATSTRMVFRGPERLRTKIRVKAAQDGVTMSGLIKSVLADELGTGYIDAKRRGSR
jgi:predicted HicB family RNase H-like nuclease